MALWFRHGSGHGARPAFAGTICLKKIRLSLISFQKGWSKKVKIICAYAVDPSLYIVDEPLIDPVGDSRFIQWLADGESKRKFD